MVINIPTIITILMVLMTYYAWRQNLYFIWYAKRMQAWMEGTYEILFQEDFHDDAVRLWTEDKPDVDLWMEESDGSRIGCLAIFIFTLIFATMIPAGLTHWFITLIACFATSAAAVVTKTLWERKHLIRGMYMGYQAILDAAETLAEDDEEHV